MVIYSDGGADPNPGIGGWAALPSFNDHEKNPDRQRPQPPRTTVWSCRPRSAPCVHCTDLAPLSSTLIDLQYVRRGITEALKKGGRRLETRNGRQVPNADFVAELQALGPPARHRLDLGAGS